MAVPCRAQPRTSSASEGGQRTIGDRGRDRRELEGATANVLAVPRLSASQLRVPSDREVAAPNELPRGEVGSGVIRRGAPWPASRVAVPGDPWPSDVGVVEDDSVGSVSRVTWLAGAVSGRG